MEYEVDVFPLCENETCEHDVEAVSVHGEDGKPNEWTCPICLTTYLFEIEWVPEISNQRKKKE